MKFEQRKSEIIKGHEIVKTPREHWFKMMRKCKNHIPLQKMAFLKALYM